MRLTFSIVVAALAGGCSVARYEPRTPLVGRAANGTELRLTGVTHRTGLFVGGRFDGSRRETRYHVHAPPGTVLVPNHWERCAIDGVQVGAEVSVDGDVDLTCVHEGPSSSGYHLPVSRWIGVGASEGARPRDLSVALPADPSRWRRVYPFAIGGAVYLARTPDARTKGLAAFPLLLGAFLGSAYVGMRAGPAFTTCAEDTCEPANGEAVEANGLLFGLEARAYPLRTGRSAGFLGGIGARIEETVSWLPTRTGHTRIGWVNALSTIHFGFGERAWTGDPKGLAEGELGFGASLTREDGGGLRVRFMASFALNFIFSL